MGWSLEEVLAHGPEILCRAYPDPAVRAEAVRFITAANGESKEFKVHTRDGRIVDTIWSRMRISDGTSIGIGRDLTEGLRVKEALREAEQSYRTIFENTHEGIFQTTPEGRYMSANPAMARMLGFDSPEELIRSRDNIAEQGYVDPGRRDEFKRLLDEFGAVTDFEFQALRKDGSVIWTSENVRAVRGQNGKVIYYEGTAQDITERKRAEIRSAAFAALARKLSGAITALRAAQIIADTARDLFGWDSLTLDLYDAANDVVRPTLSVDTIGGVLLDVTPLSENRRPSARRRRVIEHGAELIIRSEPYEFDDNADAFGDTSRPSATLMSVPIRHVSSVVGILSIQSYTPRARPIPLSDRVFADYCGEALNRISTEQSLSSEQRYRDLVEDSRECICHDLDGDRVCEFARSNLGYEPGICIKKSCVILALRFGMDR
jgi:PAS domain S-box-containing protein